MKKHIYWSLAIQSLNKNYRITLPFLGGGIIMTALFYSITSLSFNPGLDTIYGGSMITNMLGLGERIMMLFTLIFFFYLNGVFYKNSQQENGLFTVLGLEKSHLIRIQIYQFLILFIATLSIGLLLGIGLDKILFMLLLKVSGVNPSFGFYVSLEGLRDTTLWIGTCYLVIFLWSIVLTWRTNPLEALHGKQVGEKPIKNRWLLAFLGLLFLAIGYALALGIQDPMAALNYFFVAVILVILGTYLLFAFGSTVLVQLLQNNKPFYYKPNHFISVSTMRYRLKQNSMALANIAILSTMVLVTLSTTTSLIAGIDSSIDGRYSHDYLVTLAGYSGQLEITAPSQSIGVLTQDGILSSQDLLEKVLKVANQLQLDPKEAQVFLCSPDMVIQDGEETILIPPIVDIQDFNRLTNSHYTLASGELLSLTPNISAGSLLDGPNHEKMVIKEVIPRPEILDFLASFDEKESILVGDLSAIANTNHNFVLSHAYALILFNSAILDRERELYEGLKEEFPHMELLNVRSAELDKKDAFSLYVGALFVGLYLSLLFLIAVILIMYYKQLSEGLEDQKRFTILQNVGLEQKQIHKIINDQVLLLFFLPLGVALIHICFAYPKIQKILNLMTQSSNTIFLMVTGLCFVVFALIYIVIYKLTARTYFRLICQS